MPESYQKNHIKRLENESGFSFLELIIVVLLISILSVFTLLSFKAEKKYLADTQASQIIDVLHEARQRSLTQQETMRVEINQTRKTVRLIAEGEPGSASDDKELKSVPLQDTKYVVVGAMPTNVSKTPEEMSPTPALKFKKSVYPLSNGDSVATLRFVRTGKVLDAGSNAIGDNSTLTGATIYVWMPDYSSAGQPLTSGVIIRAITVQGTSGASKYLKCTLTGNKCLNWIQ